MQHDSCSPSHSNRQGPSHFPSCTPSLLSRTRRTLRAFGVRQHGGADLSHRPNSCTMRQLHFITGTMRVDGVLIFVHPACMPPNRSAVVLYKDETCPSTLKNQEFVQYIVQV